MRKDFYSLLGREYYLHSEKWEDVNSYWNIMYPIVKEKHTCLKNGKKFNKTRPRYI